MGDNLGVFWFGLGEEVVVVGVMVEPPKTKMRRGRIPVVLGKYGLLLVQVY